jgi:hypothetical protein
MPVKNPAASGILLTLGCGAQGRRAVWWYPEANKRCSFGAPAQNLQQYVSRIGLRKPE